MAKRYMITSALPYANGPLHVGHVAGAYLPADIFVRYLRMKGEDVAFICGSDEHGAAITIRAKQEGISPQQIVDKYHNIIKNAFEGLNVQFDIYHRTSSELHRKTASDFFLKLYNDGAFEERTSEQFYDEEFKQFLADRYIKGTCPNCGYEEAYGDQCENCGKSLSPTDLKNPFSTLSGKAPQLKTTKHWYLPLNKDADWLREWIESGKLNGEQQHDPKDWKKNVRGQCLSWINEGDGLQPRAITRDLDWGVPVPLEDADGKVLYVWMDAPIGYISATKQWAENEGKDWKPYWQDKDTKLIHFIGKDNIVFHCIIFPAILKAHGEYILPDNVPANEFMNLEGRKISTSRNWAVWVHEYLEEFPDKVDVLRYVLCSNLPETKDSEFTWKDWQDKNNNELVAKLGNFVNRVMVLTHKYFDGKVPDFDMNTPLIGAIEGLANLNSSYAAVMSQTILNEVKKVEFFLDQYRFRDALSCVMNIAQKGNAFLQHNEPWKIVNTDLSKTATILNASVQICRILSVVLFPFLPTTANSIRRQLMIKEISEGDETWNQELTDYWIDYERKNLPVGHQLGQAELLFQKIEDETVAAQMAKLEENLKASSKAADVPAEDIKPEITFDDFMKLDLRVGTILAAEKVKKADKLLQLTVDIGFEKRTVVSGIAEHFSPEEVVGQQVSVVSNLAPRKIRGVESKGMILMVENESGKLEFVRPAAGVPNGSVIS